MDLVLLNINNQGQYNLFLLINGIYKENNLIKLNNYNFLRNLENGKHSKNGSIFSVNKKCPDYAKYYRKKCLY